MTWETSSSTCASHKQCERLYQDCCLCPIIKLLAVVFQVQTSRQRAIMLVHAYPYVTHKDKLVSVLAEQHGEPSVHSLLSDTSKSDLQHSADWQHVTDYLNTISMANMHLHQPLLRAP